MTPASVEEVAARLTRAQRAFVEAVASRNGGMIGKRVAEAVIVMGFVSWTGGYTRVGCNSFPVRQYEITPVGRAHLIANQEGSPS